MRCYMKIKNTFYLMFIVFVAIFSNGCTMIRVDRSVNLDLQDCHVSVSSNSVSASLESSEK